MEWYRLVSNAFGLPISSVESSSGMFIPFAPANTDYQNFKIQVADGTPLQDPDGNVMTQAEADAFLETIP